MLNFPQKETKASKVEEALLFTLVVRGWKVETTLFSLGQNNLQTSEKEALQENL